LIYCRYLGTLVFGPPGADIICLKKCARQRGPPTTVLPILRGSLSLPSFFLLLLASAPAPALLYRKIALRPYSGVALLSGEQQVVARDISPLSRTRNGSRDLLALTFLYSWRVMDRCERAEINFGDYRFRATPKIVSRSRSRTSESERNSI